MNRTGLLAPVRLVYDIAVMATSVKQPDSRHLQRFENTRFLGGVDTVQQLKRPRLKQAVRQLIRTAVPAAPGVYGMLNATGHIIYVGMSKNLRQRLPIYFGAKRGGKKELKIGSKVHWILYQPVAHELLARLRERELIREFRPVHNQQGHPTRMPVGYLHLQRCESTAFKASEYFPKQHAGVWGPIPFTKQMRTAAEELNLHFQLRDCPQSTPMYFAGEATVPEDATACIRHDLATCLAPCVGACSRKAYERSVAQAKSFLTGRSQKVLDDVSNQMRQAGANQRYEQAAKLRDRLQLFTKLETYLRRFHDWMNRATFVYPLPSALVKGKQRPVTIWMIVIRGTIQGLVPRPHTDIGKQVLRKRLHEYRQQIAGETPSVLTAQPNDFEAGRLLFRWFRLHPDQKQKRYSLARAIRMLK